MTRHLRSYLSPPPLLRLVLVLLGLFSVCWSLCSPLGSIPDEPAHVIYAAAVVRGELGSGPSGQQVTVPADIASASVTTCPAFRPDVTADCALPLASSSLPVATITGAGRYPPLYYAIVGWPTLFGFNEFVWFAMRLLSVALGMALLWLAAATWPKDSPALAGGLLLAATPMTAFLLGAVNPSGVEIIAGMALALAGSGTAARCRAGEARAVLPWVSLGIIGTYLALARPSSYLLVAGLGGVMFLLAAPELMRRGRPPRQAGAALGAVAVAMVIAVVYARSAATTAAPTTTPTVGLKGAISRVARQAAGWVLQTVGIFGWLDHQPPLQVRAAWIAMTAALAVGAFLVGTRAHKGALALLLVGSVLLAPVFVFVTLFKDGLGYQARYAMALTQAVPILAGGIVHERARGRAVAARALASLPACTSIIGVLCLLGSVLRYAVGLPLGLDPLQTLRDVVWLPPAWPIVVVLLLAVCVVTARLWHRSIAAVA